MKEQLGWCLAASLGLQTSCAVPLPALFLQCSLDLPLQHLYIFIYFYICCSHLPFWSLSNVSYNIWTQLTTTRFANPIAFYTYLSPAFRCQCGSNMMVIPSLVPNSLVRSPGVISVLLTPKLVCEGSFSSFYPLSVLQKCISY